MGQGDAADLVGAAAVPHLRRAVQPMRFRAEGGPVEDDPESVVDIVLTVSKEQAAAVLQAIAESETVRHALGDDWADVLGADWPQP